MATWNMLIVEDDVNLQKLLALALPGMDGWTLLERVQRNPYTARLWCLAVTAYHDAAVETTALEAGFIAYFHKPLDVNRMVKHLRDRLSGPMVEAQTAI